VFSGENLSRQLANNSENLVASTQFLVALATSESQFRALSGSYLAARKQQVVFNGQLSEPELIKSGVPQGSILVPALLLLFINDLALSERSDSGSMLLTQPFMLVLLTWLRYILLYYIRLYIYDYIIYCNSLHYLTL